MARVGSVGRKDFFVDTSAWIPLLQERHSDHALLRSALLRASRAGGRPVTTNLVLAETYAFFRYRGHGTAALHFLRAVRMPPNIVVTSSEQLEERACTDWLEKFDDQDFSLTDAVSFAAMHDSGIVRALTLDQHFATAGFELMPGR